ncbi:uncharacterized protein PpBr36_10102 [Pyricularia pennisetigena]|uniref:uncharacterized protein n=1 Tax=Pyricularia pennisetigena TaxID=1578925 RepID=UPI0011538CA8|nr:uncharacterized protein PpBr36_10102 [Pyricularia pennisetigena]TLS22351.1 hypothetical protein PpBr36_10102 [Pyricularia pennisetigena]
MDLSSALQYGSARGFPPLHSLLRQLISVQHPGIPYRGGPEVIIDGGSADGLSKVFELLFNHWDGELQDVASREGLLVDEFVYGPPVALAENKNINVVPVAMDAQGLLAHGPGGLEEVLENWDDSRGKRPHVLYTIPTGQNPTSGVMSLSRRRDVYKLCSRFDVVVVEDDPYFHLYYPTPDATGPFDLPSTGHAFLDELVPSFIRIDEEGRVIRLDSFSKSIAPGCRLGWITASPAVCDRLFAIVDDTTQQPSGFAQVVVARLLSEPVVGGGGDNRPSWGLDGWVCWLQGLRSTYRRRMIKMATVLEGGKLAHSAGGDETAMFEFCWPTGGMFLWVEVKIENHALALAVDAKRLMRALWLKCIHPPYLVLTVAGENFAATEKVRNERGHKFLRFCFAAVEEDELGAKSRSFVDACRDFWSIRNMEDIEDIFRDEESYSAQIPTA